MGKSSKRRRKIEEESDSGPDFGSEDMEDDNKENYDEDDDDEFHDVENDEDDEDDVSDNEDEEDSDEEEEEGDDARKDAEMEELEKEYMELQHSEQDILRNLRRHKDEDLLKGESVKNQKALWDKALELRFLLQKPFSNSNRLPQEPVRSSFCNSDAGVSEAYSDLLTSSKKAIDSILELLEAILEKNPSITQSADVNSAKNSKSSETSGNSHGGDDEQWLKISQMQARMASFRDKSIDKWQRKTQVTTGAAAIKGKLQAFNQNISQQVAAYMRDPSKMIKGMQQNRSAVAVIGVVPESMSTTKQEDINANGDPELLDDSEFYQQLLKEFFETIDPTSSVAAFYAMKRLQSKKRKVVDRRASKSRKIRYNVHEKIVNFMVPQPMDLPPMAPKLFEDLFGLKSHKLTSTL